MQNYQCYFKEVSMPENNILISEFLNSCIEKQLPFAVYQLPNTGIVKVCVQTDSEVITFNSLEQLMGKDGFVFVPFDKEGEYKSLFVRADINLQTNELHLDHIHQLPNCFKESLIKECSPLESSKELYIEQVTEMINELQDNKLDKVILSRIHMLDGYGMDNAISSFLKLTVAYNSAFVHLTSIPGVGTWIGASPETLLTSNENGSETVALAGTQKIEDRKLDEILWKDKELEEQAYVCRYIENTLKENNIEKCLIEGPYTVQAGNIVHLKTTYRFQLDSDFKKLSILANALHPTPAVCGLPKSTSSSLIRKVEKHDREYYAGYLGPLESNGSASFFVNLRSMKVLDKKMALYVGGGITAASKPELEWEETCLKAQTLLNVIS